MDVMFKIVILILGVFIIIIYYSDSHGRYQYVILEERQFTILDTRDGIIHFVDDNLHISASINLTDGNAIAKKVKVDGEPIAPAP
jgi:hypothetical protein